MFNSNKISLQEVLVHSIKCICKAIIYFCIRFFLTFFPVFLKETVFHIVFDSLPHKYQLRWRERFDATNAINRLRHLKEKGFTPQTILDCGAYQGEWTNMAKEVFPDANVLMIEAQPEKRVFLEQIKANHKFVDYIITALGPENGEGLPFYFMETGSSFLEEQSDMPRKIINLPMRTVDSLMKEKGISEVSLLKLDVQGYELEVLKGAIDTLSKIAVIFMEVSFLPYNKSAPLFREVVCFMADQGFLVYDIASVYRWKDGTLLQADIVFVHENSSWRHSFFSY